MKKLELVDRLSKECNLTRNEAAALVKVFFDEMSEALANGDRVEIRACVLYT